MCDALCTLVHTIVNLGSEDAAAEPETVAQGLASACSSFGEDHRAILKLALCLQQVCT